MEVKNCILWDSFDTFTLTLGHLLRKKAAQRPHFLLMLHTVLAQLLALQVKCTHELLRISMFSSSKEPHVKIKVSPEWKQDEAEEIQCIPGEERATPARGSRCWQSCTPRCNSHLWNPGLEFALGYVSGPMCLAGWQPRESSASWQLRAEWSCFRQQSPHQSAPESNRDGWLDIFQNIFSKWAS